MKKLMPVLVLVALASGCQQAYLDGAWSGTLECNNTSYDIDASLEQSLETRSVEGAFFIEYEVDLGFLGRHRTWEKGEIDDGEWEPADDSFSGRIVPTSAQADGQAPSWLFELAPNDKYTELNGELERLDQDGDVVATCDAELDPVGEPGN